MNRVVYAFRNLESANDNWRNFLYFTQQLTEQISIGQELLAAWYRSAKYRYSVF